MEGRFSVGIMFGVLFSVPLWLSMIGWYRLVMAGIALFI